MIDDLEGLWKGMVWLILGFCPGICVLGLRKTLRNLNQNSESLGQDSDSQNPQLSGHKAGVPGFQV